MENKGNVIRLDSKGTTYLIGINETGHLQNLYYGRRLRQDSLVGALMPKNVAIGDSPVYSEQYPNVRLQGLCLEVGCQWKGDFRSPSIEIEYEDGQQVLDLLYRSHNVYNGKKGSVFNQAWSYGDEQSCTTLEIELRDRILPIRLILSYTVFNESNVITRSATLVNDTASDITIKNIASMNLDLADSDWNIVTFDGAWGRERSVTRRPVSEGAVVFGSRGGVSGSFHNPCFFLERPDCSFNHGDCYGFNLIYSGNHREVVEKSPYGQLRIQSGINPDTFTWKLKRGDRFQTPEAVMTYSPAGANGASVNLHRFVNENIVRGYWKNRQRPVVFNNWEATAFDFTEDRILSLAKKASELGIELFVLDDGWFGTRDDATSSLGDWVVNAKKLPSGLTRLSQRIHDLGMLFGIWMEPEMVSRKSMLFTEHPQWAIMVPGRDPSVGRHQYILDLTRSDVRDYIVNSVSEVIRLSEADYVKWDMNRMMSDLYSYGYFSKSELCHRYVLGLYDVFSRLVQTFPKVLFEGCASGGNRFDLGILCYMSQIWTSDNTDVHARSIIQNGTSYGYPQSTMGAHVSASPNHQTLRRSDIESRFNVAAFGVLGYEMDICALNKQQTEIVRSQIAFYKQFRDILQFGRFFRISEGKDGQHTQWAVANGDFSVIIVLDYQGLNTANIGQEVLRVPIARADYDYEVIPRQQRVSIRVFGDQIKRMSPIKIGNDGKFAKLLADYFTFDSEIEHYRVSGDVLSNFGIRLNPQFCGRGYNNQTRVLGDFGSRMYILTKVDEEV